MSEELNKTVTTRESTQQFVKLMQKIALSDLLDDTKENQANLDNCNTDELHKIATAFQLSVLSDVETDLDEANKKNNELLKLLNFWHTFGLISIGVSATVIIFIVIILFRVL